jgi:polyisoprenoid-binding protein YceI
VAVSEGTIKLDAAQPEATLTVDLATLRSGNTLYDAELLRRIDARAYPVTTLELRSAVRVGQSLRYRVDGDLTFHGVTQSISGSVEAEIDGAGHLHVTGEHVFDIRDFGVVAPNVLMLRIYPDVRIELQLEAATA